MPTDKNISIKPDFDTDVLWRPNRMGRTISTSSASSNDGTQRRTSITEMFFGNRPAMIRQTSTTSETDSIGTPERSPSITETRDFKEFMRRQRHVLQEQ